MLDVLTDGPIHIMKVNLVARQEGEPAYITKQKLEWTSEGIKRNNLNSVDNDICFKAVDENIFLRIKTKKTSKEVWDSLIAIGEGDKHQKDKKLTWKPLDSIGAKNFRATLCMCTTP